METNNVYKKTEQYVTRLFEENLKPELVFHTIDHTRAVVNRTKEICGHYYLNEEDTLAVYIAAWFHDTGYLFADADQHEDKSVELMNAFATESSLDESLRKKAEECILATRSPRTHDHLREQIICDADTYHFGTKEFKESNKQVMEEYQRCGNQLSEKEWDEKTIAMLKKHEYYTKYCKDLLEDKKQKNMKKLKKKEEELEEVEGSTSLSDLHKDKTGLMSKGIQTMLRLTSENHLRLSDMADRKANILISVNAIIISVILGVLFRKLEEVPQYTIPTVIFLAVAVVTIVLSIIATRPQISGGTFTEQDVFNKKTNLLFFGNFHRASYDQYNTAMKDMMRDTDYLYDSLLKDIHTLGTVLGRKYRLLHLAYNIFMIGIVVSVIAFGIATFVFHSQVTGTITPASGPPF
jgi:predicted metal-dependent HD superfamily phosphohydrolase